MITETPTREELLQTKNLRRPRIGVICDFVEENWPSMDLVAEMLTDHLEREHPSTLDVSRVRPSLRPRFGTLPAVGKAPVFRNADRLMNRFVEYRRYLKRRVEDFDLFHVIDHSYSQLVHDLPVGAAVVTCHDLDTFRCVLEPERQRRPLWFRLMTERILSGFRKAAHVIAVSSATRDEILRFGLHPASRITVIPNGVHPTFTAAPDAAADAELSRLLVERAGSGFARPADTTGAVWMLNVGSSMRRKRLDLLLRIFAEVRKHVASVRLLRVGEPMTREHRELARKLNVESGIVELTSLSRELLAAVYRRAGLLVHTADAEGFGLPLIEAMACGCQVIASDLPVLREVGGEAATYHAVGDIEDWKQGIVAALEQQRDLNQRKRQQENGFARAAHFSWAENAARVVRVYQQLLGKEL